MRVVEKFISINGEGPRAGELAVFVRFQGCNLNCGYCDTKWANEPSCKFTEESPGEIAAWVFGTGIRNVTLTGGEPLLQGEIRTLIGLLLHEKSARKTVSETPAGDADSRNEESLRVEIETNGAVDLKTFSDISPRPVFTMDWKLPGSGMERFMLPGNFSCLRPGDTVKFVCSSRTDLMRAAELIGKYRLTERCHVDLSPVFGEIEPAEIVEFMKERRLNDVRIRLQIHKVIWDPAARGV